MANKILFVDRHLARKVQGSSAVNEAPDISISPAPNDASALQPEFLQPPRPTTITPAGPATISTNQSRYRALPPRNRPTTHPPTTKKRKHAPKSGRSRPVHYFEGSGSEGEGDGYKSGDGSSSGDSIPSDTPTNVKRQKISRIVTRSSTQTPVPDVGNRGPSDSIPRPPAALTPLPTVTACARSSASETATAVLPGISASHTNDLPRAKPMALAVTDTEPTNTTDDTAPSDSAPGDSTSDHTEPDLVPDSSPPPTTLIKAGDVPTFLRHHGRGKRAVDIFAYLNEVKDPHFQRILFHYIRFEASDESGAGGTLPTAGRPAEITWWTSRARPSDIPDLSKGSRTLKTFTDSVLRWWGSIQPSWRTFRQGEASREVNGSWESLRAPRINGLLNVVVLAYWWVSVLNEGNLEDGVREDYKFFADDVAWVFSKLLTA